MRMNYNASTGETTYEEVPDEIFPEEPPYIPEPTLEERLASLEDDLHTIVVAVAASVGIVP